jgi:hypothetical protein
MSSTFISYVTVAVSKSDATKNLCLKMKFRFKHAASSVLGQALNQAFVPATVAQGCEFVKYAGTHVVAVSQETSAS